MTLTSKRKPQTEKILNKEIGMDNSIIRVEQLPVIVERLHQIKEEIEERTAQALGLECTEETYRDVKKERAELNKTYADFEARRKEVKSQILAPYEAFEEVYRECIALPFKKADALLAGKISGVEEGMKDAKRQEVTAYYTEYRESLGLKPDDAPIEKARINVTMSASLKSLKDAARAHLDKTADDIAMIREQEHADEIMAEYRRCGNASQAVMVVNQRHREIEAERKRNEEADLVAQLRQKYEADVDEAREAYAQEAADVPSEVDIPDDEEEPAPYEEQPPEPQDAPEEEVYEMTFTVRGTLAQLRELKKYLKDGGYINE